MSRPQQRQRTHANPHLHREEATKGLNRYQADAVRCIDGPLIIFAGAGSGKTRVITHRMRYMILEGIPATSLVAVTFTNKSAREMKARLYSMMDRKSLRGSVLTTFHSLGNRILQREIESLPSYRLPFSIVTPDDTGNAMAEIYRDLKLDPTTVREDGILFHISLCKNSGIEPFDYANERGSVPADLFEELYKRYHQTLLAWNSVDFDDLILLPTRLLKSNPEVLQRYRQRWRYFLVDEFQDTNPSQYDLLRLLVGSDHNICVVGDDDQSIYGWRGADVSIIRNFERDFAGAKSVRLEYNYRSTKVILDAANAVIRNNTTRVAKQLRHTGAEGRKIVAMQAENEEREAQLVVEVIRTAIIRGKRQPGDFAILFRTNFQSRVFEQELRRHSIPLHLVGGYKFFDRREVKDMIAWLRSLANPRDEISLKRIINRPRRGIGEGTIRKINEFIQSHDDARPDFVSVLQQMMAEPGVIAGVRSDQIAALNDLLEVLDKFRKLFAHARPLSPALTQLIRELNFEQEFQRDGDNENSVKARMLNLSELVNMLSYMESEWEESEPPTLFDFLQRLSIQAGDLEEEAPSGRVQLLTLHLSKGLEYPVVFLTGLEEGLFPSGRSLEESADQNGALEEERRLFYVGITRAQQELFISLSAARRRFGEESVVEPSRFLSELPEDLVEWRHRVDDDTMLTPEEREAAARDMLLAGLAELSSGEESAEDGVDSEAGKR